MRRALGDAGGLSNFGVNLLELPPGTWSSQRHWHSAEDEFVYVLSGEVDLIDDDGEQTLRAGDCAAFPKAKANGHHLINRSNAMAVCLEVGTRSSDDVCTYSDIDLHIGPGRSTGYTHKDGEPYLKRG
ncbi:MAG: cupin domain-containing protein [Rhodanobacteraceae bacterium]